MAAQFAIIKFHMEGEVFDIVSIESIEGYDTLQQDDTREFIVNWIDGKPYPVKVLAIAGIALITSTSE